MATTEVSGLYDDNWNGVIVPEAFAHPAKMARGVVRWIFDRLNLPAGSLVADPFGGVGTTGIEGSSRGLRVVCCELEQKFVDLARQNFALHRHVWEQMGDPLPVIVCGDSRELRKHVGEAAAIVGSPPFCESLNSGETAADMKARWPDAKLGGSWGQSYGNSPGQLGGMPSGEVEAVLESIPGVDCVVSSPPYEGMVKGDNSEKETIEKTRRREQAEADF